MLLDEVRLGGMGTVQKAFDRETNGFAAIKRMKTSGDQQRLAASFEREVEALRHLEHPNIVKFLKVDRDDEGRWFLAMEWIEQNLEAFLMEHGPMTWNRFLSDFGRPMLSALEHAQVARNLIHRDLNPRNILVTEKGIPKITDYGISKVLDDRDSWMPVAGKTFVDARTPGFSPKEQDDRVYSRSRDCFSLAAVSVFCVVGRRFVDDADLAIALQEAPFPDAVRSLVENALSDDPRRRPFDARMMRLDLERIEEARVLQAADAIPCYLDIATDTESRLRSLLNLGSRDAVQSFILEELSETHALTFQRFPDGATNSDRIEIVGVTWRFRALYAGRSRERLEIIDAYEIDAARAGKLREGAYRAPVAFSFDRPIDVTTAAETLREFLGLVRNHEQQRQEARQALNSERVFRAWKSYLRDRLHLETNRANAIHYTRISTSNSKVVFTADVAPSSDIIGQDRFVRVGGRHVFGRVTQVLLDQVTIEVTKGDPDILPRKGELLLNTVAAERALAYQSSALDAVMYGRIIAPRLRQILLDPSSALPPEEVDISQLKSSSLAGEKLSVLRQALGTSEILAVEGPPGTSKTDLISEIAVGWLSRHPNHRVLLSSQTHTALDEAIERISKLNSEWASKIIRIGRSDDPRIGAISKPLMLEQKVEHWANEVRKSAEENLEIWAAARGVDRALVALGMKVERLVQLLRQKAEVERRIAEEEIEVDEAEQRLEDGGATPDEFDELGLATIEISDELALLKTARKNLRQQEKSVRADLANGPDLGPDLSHMSDISDLEEWQGVYLSGSDAVRECKQRLELLENWLLRVGRTGDFNAAVLNDAKIIAGTCVGMAGVKGIEEVEYDLCIVDEASKATATEILIPMSRSRRWIIVGDPKQLPPFFEEFGPELVAEYDEIEIRHTVLDRMIDAKAGLPKECRAQLNTQHRMITPIGDLVSSCFYGGTLQSPIASHGLKLDPEIPAPVTWFTTSRERRREENPLGKTFHNSLEVEWTKHVLHRLQSAAARQAREISVAVISGYTAQVKKLVEMTDRNASDWPSLKISCNSVDAFQGKQADVCIYSVTRSNGRRRIGFLKEKPRLNVALSRARSALILIGDHHFCRVARGENPFLPVIDWVESHPNSCHIGTLQA